MGTDYEPYFPALKKMLVKYMAIDWIDRETCWSTFTFHSIPLDTTMNDVNKSLWNNYHELTVAKTWRWHVTDETKCNTKKDGTLNAVSTIVISLLEN